MAQAPRTAGDGFDQGFGFLDGSHTPVKQGWLCCLQSSIDLHSTGFPDADGRYVVRCSTQDIGMANRELLLGRAEFGMEEFDGGFLGFQGSQDLINNVSLLKHFVSTYSIF